MIISHRYDVNSEYYEEQIQHYHNLEVHYIQPFLIKQQQQQQHQH